MSDLPSQPLLALWSEALHQLRREHWLRWLWPGLWCSIICLLLLAIIRLYLSPVSITLAALLMLAPLLLTSLCALVSDRLDSRCAVQALDRWFNGKALMTSAQEVLSSPGISPGISPAGRRVLQQATGLVPSWRLKLRERALLPVTAQPRWMLALALLTLFLLQLPAPDYPDPVTQQAAAVNTPLQTRTMTDANGASTRAHGSAASGTEAADGRVTQSGRASLDPVWKEFQRSGALQGGSAAGAPFSELAAMEASAGTYPGASVEPEPDPVDASVGRPTPDPAYRQSFTAAQRVLIKAYFQAATRESTTFQRTTGSDT